VERAELVPRQARHGGVQPAADRLRSAGAGVPWRADDRRGLLEGDYKDRRLARFDTMADVEAKRTALAAVVSEWVALVAALP